MKTTAKLWIGVGALALLSPLGIYLPDKFKAGSAWGEWGPHEIGGLIGYIPKGLEKLSSLWNSLFPDYAFKGWEDKGLGHLSLAYFVSAAVGIGLCVAAALLIGKLLVKKNEARSRKNDEEKNKQFS
jgi:ammonia channel protein AmtB